MKITIATCQFPITSDIRRNLGYVKRQMKSARDKGADLAHFSECCLGGYAGVDLPSLEGYDWDLLQRSAREVTELARELGLWVILGSNHKLSGDHRPHNSLYLIDPQGKVVDRYDKRFCTGSRARVEDDLSHYSPGNQFVVFQVKGVRCGLQICHDFRYPELYREYKRRDVQLMFHSYHNGGMTPEKKREYKDVWGVLVRATMQTYAASNFMWISVNNTARRESSGSSFVVQPDGLIAGRLPLHRAGVLVTTIDAEAPFYDASKEWRSRAMLGVLHSGSPVEDPRSDDRTCL